MSSIAESGDAPESRTIRILRVLRRSPGGLSTPQLVAELAEGIEPLQKALTWYGGILRRHEDQGNVERAGRTPGGWQQGISTIWHLTDQGEKFLAYADEAPVREAERQRLAAEMTEAARMRADALAEAARECSRGTPRTERRIIAGRLRQLGCSLEEIGQVFGVSREMIRQDLLPCEPSPPRSSEPLGQRLVSAAILNGTLAVSLGKRTMYFTKAEAAQIAEVISRWDAEADRECA